jgi:hypothetical protein
LCGDETLVLTVARIQVSLAADADQLLALAGFLEKGTPSPRIGDLYIMPQAR